MFARLVRMNLKANQLEFTRTLQTEVLPVLRRQRGFQDEIAFVAPDAREAVAISLWEQREQAESYQREVYPDVLRIISKIVEGTPEVKTFEVTNSTFHKIAAKAA